MKRPGERYRSLFLAVPFLIWIGAFALPLGAVFSKALGSLGSLEDLWRSSYYRGVLEFTAVQAGWSTLAALALGLPGAYLLGRTRFPGRRVLRALTTVPFVLPPLLVAIGFVLVFGHRGAINHLIGWIGGGSEPALKILYSMGAIVLAHVFYNFPLTMRIVGDAWSRIPRDAHRAAASLGAGPLRTFRTITVPQLLPSILTAATLTFLYCFLSFAVVLILGGGPHLSTLEVEVYRLVTQRLDLRAGAALALVETLLALGILGLYALTDRRSRRLSAESLSSGPRMEPRRLRGAGLAMALPYLLFTVLLVLGPLVAVAGGSLLRRATRGSPASITLSHWIGLFGGGRVGGGVAIRALLNTAALGIVVAAAAAVIGAGAAWILARRRGRVVGIAEALIALPLGTGSVILGLGYLILSRRLPGTDALRWAILAAVHVVIALPFVYYLVAGRLRELPSRLGDAAASLGSRPLSVFLTVDLPLAKRALITSAVFAFALSAGELNAALIIAPAGFSTVPLVIYRLAGAYEIFGACALGTLLIGISAIAFYLLDKYGESRP